MFTSRLLQFSVVSVLSKGKSNHHFRYILRDSIDDKYKIRTITTKIIKHGGIFVSGILFWYYSIKNITARKNMNIYNGWKHYCGIKMEEWKTSRTQVTTDRNVRSYLFLLIFLKKTSWCKDGCKDECKDWFKNWLKEKRGLRKCWWLWLLGIYWPAPLSPRLKLISSGTTVPIVFSYNLTFTTGIPLFHIGFGLLLLLERWKFKYQILYSHDWHLCQYFCFFFDVFGWLPWYFK